MTYNVHLLSHLVNCVEQCRPLWAYSPFHFEGNNATLCNFINGTTDALQQVTEKYIFKKSIDLPNMPDIIKSFEESLYKGRKNRSMPYCFIN